MYQMMHMEMATRDTMEGINKLLWPAEDVIDDRNRWFKEKVSFLSDDQTLLQCADPTFSLGLVQTHGGPCGILAVIQAEIIRHFLFDNTQSKIIRTPHSAVDFTMRQQLLARAIITILRRCNSSTSEIQLVVPVKTPDTSLAILHIKDPKNCEKAVMSHLEAFMELGGVLYFVYSVMLTRGVGLIRSDMDDCQSTLTSTFGHCSQELVNLLLVGRATSNVFDGSIPLGESGMWLHGIERRPTVGYLTQLETLRYCEVGNYYKCPQYPIWVVGSASHFTVLFGQDISICALSESQMLFQRTKRVFTSFDRSDSGCIEISALYKLLEALGVANALLKDAYKMSRLYQRLELGGSGIILWEEFWKVVSVLIHTGDLEQALQTDSTGATSQKNRIRSDSDIARELQAKLDAGMEPEQFIEDTVETASPQIVESPLTHKTCLYHYNGMRREGSSAGTSLSECIVTWESYGTLIGRSVPIKDQTLVRSDNSEEMTLNDIVRTKWPSAEISWKTGSAPKIE